MAQVCSLTVLMAVFASFAAPTNTQQQPNIIMIVADDLGWSDPERHDPLMRTPILTKMAERGVFLNQSYVQPTCAPTRSSLLTGRYAYTYGMQKNEIEGSAMAWLNETLVLLPTEMRKLGYSTHALGKWHLGFCDWEVVPTRRGFDTFYGYLSGTEGYFSHQGGGNNSYDFWDNEQIDFSAKGLYSTELFTKRAQEIIQGRDRSQSQPFFMYLAYQNVHAPFEVKPSYIEKYCSHVTNKTRRIHCAMAAAMDEGIGNITDTLDAEGLTDNTIILFLSDNGGPVFDGAVNYPLRGGKASIWEGGTRSFTILNAPGLRNTNTTWPGMINAIDWFPTLLQAAGGKSPDYVDGIAMWNQIIDNADSLRDEFVYNINDYWGTKGLRWKNWKLIKGPPGKKNGWYPPYQLLELGYPWEDIGKDVYPKSEWHFYNLEVDPYERENVIDRLEYAKIVSTMKKKLQKYEERLQPYVEAPKTKAFNELTKALGYWAPGWCNVTLESRTNA